MTLAVYVRGEKEGDRDLLTRLFAASHIDNWELRDLNTQSLASFKPTMVAVAMGRVCGNIIKNHAQQVFVFPTINRLLPEDGNQDSRQEAWELLPQVKAALEESQIEENSTSSSWRHATIYIGSKKLCVYEEKRPPGIQADVFISKSDLDLLLRVKEAFKADAMLIQDGEVSANGCTPEDAG